MEAGKRLWTRKLLAGLFLVSMLLSVLGCYSTPTPTATPAPTAPPPIHLKPTPPLMHTPSVIPTAKLTPVPNPTPAPTSLPTVPVAVPTAPTLTPTVTPIDTLEPPEKGETLPSQLRELLPWFDAPPDQDHADLAMYIAKLRWTDDGIDPLEAEAISMLADIAVKEMDLAHYLSQVSWMFDAVTEDEVAWLAWFTETEVEWQKLAPLIARGDRGAQVVHRAMQLPWIIDGVHDNDLETIDMLMRVIEADLRLAEVVLEAPWMARGAGYRYARTLEYLAALSGNYGDLAFHIASSPWFGEAQHLTGMQYDTVRDLASVAHRDERLGEELARRFVGEFRLRDQYLLASLVFLMSEGSDFFQRLSQQSWVVDGIEDEEAAFIIATPDVAKNSPRDFYEMLTTRHVTSKSVELPLTGNVVLWAVQKVPFEPDDPIMEDIAETVRYLEELTGAPLPTRDVVTLVIVTEPDSDFEQFESNLVLPWPSGAYSGRYVRIPRATVSGRVSMHVLRHELAHYYFNFVPAWLMEGGPEFAVDYVRFRSGELTLEHWRSTLPPTAEHLCPKDARNLHDLGYPGVFYVADPNRSCFYTMGNHFLSSLFHALGEETTKRAMNEIFLLVRSFDERPPDTRPITGKDVYLAYHKHVRPEQIPELNEIFGQLHGGPLAGITHVAEDDVGNTAAEAKDVAVGTTARGELEHAMDVDYFRFSAESGQEYRSIFNHNLIAESYLRGDLFVKLHFPDGRPPETLRDDSGSVSGLDDSWVAPLTGDYYYSLMSTSGVTGAYEFSIHPVDELADDHTDGAEGATDAGIGVAIEGRIDSVRDVDYFRVQAVAGRGYTAKVESHSVGHTRVVAYEDDGTDVKEWDGWMAQWGAEVSWRADRSGDYLLAVDSHAQNTGAYTLTLQEFAPGGDDHMDTSGDATRVTLGAPAAGSMDDAFDRDYFRFSAQAGSIYLVKVDHVSLGIPITLYAPDGTTPLLMPGGDGAGHVRGAFFPWAAPETGDYFLEFRSINGITGRYVLTVLLGVPGQDDHGNIPDAATELTLGKGVMGSLDHDADFDYFQFQAEEGRHYEVAARFTGDSDKRALLYTSNGFAPADYYLDFGRRESGSYVVWVAADSGTVHVVMYSPRGDTGPYTVEVTLVDG